MIRCNTIDGDREGGREGGREEGREGRREGANSHVGKMYYVKVQYENKTKLDITSLEVPENGAVLS